MKFGVTIPNNWGIADPQHVLAMGPAAEALGYDSIWVMPRLPGDNVDQMVAGISAYQKAGVDHVVLALNTGDLARIAALMEDIARNVIPRFR